MANLKQVPCDHKHIILPNHCYDAPPDAINMYTDGCYTSPTCHSWAIGAAGTWTATKHSNANDNMFWTNVSSSHAQQDSCGHNQDSIQQAIHKARADLDNNTGIISNREKARARRELNQLMKRKQNQSDTQQHTGDNQGHTYQGSHGSENHQHTQDQLTHTTDTHVTHNATCTGYDHETTLHATLYNTHFTSIRVTDAAQLCTRSTRI